jgi:uncharacterized protein YndB with AHSA1/START domain
MKFSVETLVDAPVAKVSRAYTAPDDIKHWNRLAKSEALCAAAKCGNSSIAPHDLIYS